MQLTVADCSVGRAMFVLVTVIWLAVDSLREKSVAVVALSFVTESRRNTDCDVGQRRVHSDINK
jgi:hypothetical protein